VSQEEAPLGAPDDAGDLRGYYFKQLLGSSLTLTLIAVAAIGVGVIGYAAVGPGIGALGFFGTLAITLIVIFIVAGSRSEGAFFDSYASQRRMTASGKRPLPPWTPLLRKGDDRYAERVLEGPLSDGVEGMLALYTYEEQSSDGQGDSETNHYRYTIGMTEVPQCADFVHELICQRKFGLRALEKVEDAFRAKQRVEFESEGLTEHYEIFVGKDQDQNWLRQLFSPTFIVWLTESAPKKFAFELVDGELCCYVSGHRKDAADLDQMRAATATIASRLREEADEEQGPERLAPQYDG
jgi:hypothetical protein